MLCKVLMGFAVDTFYMLVKARGNSRQYEKGNSRMWRNFASIVVHHKCSFVCNLWFCCCNHWNKIVVIDM